MAAIKTAWSKANSKVTSLREKKTLGCEIHFANHTIIEEVRVFGSQIFAGCGLTP